MDDTIRKYQDYVMTGFVKAVEPVVIDHASGAIVVDQSGIEYLDCFAGISVNNSGHCNPQVIAAAKEQIEKLVHCCSYVYHSHPVADLAEKLAMITPGRLRKTFFGNGGAEAVEAALRLARLYTGKKELISLQLSFHGRSWATLSITGNAGRKRGGGPFAPGVSFLPAPYTYRSVYGSEADAVVNGCVDTLRDLLRFSTSGDVAAFIAEPVMGEGGIIVPPEGFFKAVKEVLDEHGILFIADEVQSGFARTGRMFAIEYYGVEPDMLVTAKGIAGGFPLSGVTTRDEIAAAFRPGDHLSTFGGNPVSCAAALANIEFIEKEDLCGQACRKGEKIVTALNNLKRGCPLIGEVRGKGLMIGVELVKDEKKTPAADEAASIRRVCRERGLLLGLGGAYANVLRIQPPLVIADHQVDRLLEVLSDTLAEASATVWK